MFLSLLREQHNDVWEDAFAKNYIICIPQSVSLARRIRREDIETHILRPAPNEFKLCYSEFQSQVQLTLLLSALGRAALAPAEVGCTEACHGNGACLDSRCAAPRRIAR